MKKLYFFFLAISCWLLAISYCQAQNYVTIPDTAFVRWLQNNTVLSGCMNGNQLDTSCQAVLSKRTLDCSIDNGGGNITNLTGIQYFKNLDSFICNGNLLSQLPSLPSNLTYLNCAANQLTSLSKLPSSLNYLYCSGNRIDSFPVSPPNLYYLDCSLNQLVSLPVLPSFYLSFLDCSNNQLTNLPVLPYPLTYLNCSGNKLDSLPELPSGLNSLDCSYNQLTGLPGLPSMLQFLTCSGNQLTSLPGLDLYLNFLYCNNNNLTVLPQLPDVLHVIYCYSNQLTSLPALPAQLSDLWCYSNELTSLPVLPSGVSELECSNNQLTYLPDLTPFIETLYCDYNQLTNLPVLPSLLSALTCSHNQLTSLPGLPSSLSELDCSQNNIIGLPALPSTMFELLVDSNKMLTCLPQFLTLTGNSYNFNISGTGIVCLANHMAHPSDNIPAIDTMPLCGIYNPNGCEAAWGINGSVSFDTIKNCDTIFDEPSLGNIKIQLFDSTGNLLQQVYSFGNGQFSFEPHLGKYIVRADTTGTPFTVLCPDSNIHHSNLMLNDSLDYGANFRLVCKNGYDVGVNSIIYSSGQFFPGRNATVNIQADDMATYYGVNCNTAGLAGTVVAVITGPVTVLSVSGNGVISGNTVTWNVTDFSLTNFATAFFVVLNTNTNAKAGDQVCIDVTVAANSGIDNNPSNNNLTQCFAVVVSHDPNFKEVYPSSTTNPGEWLTYTIHFQNTGTSAAENIYVLDTIDNNLDISTIQVVAMSNNALVQVLPGRIVRFSFPNIFLPDSLSNVEGSIGYVQYKIKTTPAIASGTTINNTASVYFDYNTPVQTNTAVSVYDISTSNKELRMENGQLRIYPNPTGGVVNVVLSNQCDGCLISITDVLGRVVEEDALSGKQTTIDLSSLAAGIYYIRVTSANTTATAKVIKQ